MDCQIKNSKFAISIALLLFFLSPLIFFTDLTRNPYYFQITVVNILLSVFLLYLIFLWFKNKSIDLKINSLLITFLIVLLAFFISSVISYFGHSNFYRPSIINEFERVWMFTIVNCLVPFFLSMQIPFEADDVPKYNYSFAFIVIWGISWFLFPYFKSDSKFFDIYGILIWLAGFIYLFKKTAALTQNSIIKIAMLSGFFASAYGILQYFGFEFIWPKILNPYGRRAVSTFGNPNFVSSYVLMLIPFSFYYMAKSKNRWDKIIYFVFTLSYAGMIFASLTRSTLIGLFFMVIFLFSFKDYRKFIALNLKSLNKLLITVVIVLLLWPDQNLKPLSFGVINRIYDGAKNSVSKLTLNLKEDEIYPSFHQRLLIWTGGMMMFKENPVTGNGWGSFELFYPFYQGKLMRDFPATKEIRTHANNAHNEIMEILSQTGILGAGISFFFLFLFFHLFLKFIRSDSDNNEKLFLITAVSSVSSMLVDNLLNVSMHFSVPGLLFFWLLGSVSLKTGTKNIHIEFKKMIKLIALLISAFFIYVIVVWSLQFMREVYYFEGFKKMRGGNYVGARVELEKAYKFNSKDVNTNYELANAYTKFDDTENAIFMYRKAIDANAGYDEIYFNLGVIEKKNMMNDDAIKNFRTSLWINPMNEKSYYAIAEIMLAAPAKYAADLERIMSDGIKIHRYNSYIMSILGYIYEIKKDYNKAYYYYKLALINEPLNNSYLSNFERISKNSDKKTLEFIKIYRDVYLNNIFDADYLGRSLSKLEKDFGDFSKFKFLKAKYCFETKDYETSERLLKDIIREDKSFNGARYSLAAVYEKMGRNDDAIALLEDYVSVNPQNSEAVDKLKKLKLMR
ncbi:MAG: O-antigen ligase family protein [Elusimicrobiales bacterium]|nr:O-antigen ligase family protein [Elusimicrobiales bacterium]